MTEDLTYKEGLLKALDDGEYSYKDICLELIDFLYEEQIVDFSHEKGYLND